MNFLSSIAFTSLFFASAFAGGKICSVPESNQQAVENLIRNYEVRALCSHNAIISCDNNEDKMLASRYKVQKFEYSENLFCFEKESVENSEQQHFSNLESEIIFHLDSEAFLLDSGKENVWELEGFRAFSIGKAAMKPTSFVFKSPAASFMENDVIEKALNSVSSSSLKSFAEYLTGEAFNSSFVSRNAYGQEVVEAAKYAQAHYIKNGFTAVLQTFDKRFGPNVIAEIKGTEQPDSYIVIGAHIDSRAINVNSPTDRAPGANDDGSGTAMLLELARIIGENKIRFKKSVIFGSWGAEEQGLVGSRYFAKFAKSNELNIEAMFQGDMLAYRRAGEDFQVGFPNRYHTVELTEAVVNITNTYVPQLKTCTTSACCSDHQSFYEQGYASTQFFERCGSIADDQYHKSGDLVNRSGYDIQQLTYISKAMFASLLTFAEAY